MSAWTPWTARPPAAQTPGETQETVSDKMTMSDACDVITDKAVWRIQLRSLQQVAGPLRGGPGAEPLPQPQDQGQEVRKALK